MLGHISSELWFGFDGSVRQCITMKSFLFRLIRLLEEIMSEKENKTIIFVETKRRCDDLTRRMRRDG